MSRSSESAMPLSAKGVASDSALLMFASVAVVVTGVVRNKVSAVWLSQSEFAAVAQATQVFTLLLALSTVGLVTGVRVVLSRATNDQHALELGATAVRIVAGISLLVAGLSVATYTFWGEFVFGELGRSVNLNLVVPAVIPASLAAVVMAAAQGRREFRQLLVAALSAALAGSLITILVVSAWGVSGAMSSILLVSCLQLAVLVLVVPTGRAVLTQRPEWRVSELGPLFQIGAGSLILAIVAAVTETIMRGTYVGKYGLEGLADYQPLYVLSSQGFALLLGALGTSMLVHVGLAASNGDPGIGRAFNKTVRQFVLALAAVTLLVQLVARTYVALLFSSTLSVAPELIRWQLVVEVLRAAVWAAGAALLPLALTRAWLMTGLSTVAVSLGTFLTVLDRAGLLSFPIASGVGWLVGLGATGLALAPTRLAIAPKTWLAILVSGGLAMAGAGAAMNTLQGWPWVVTSLAAVSAGFAWRAGRDHPGEGADVG